MILQVGEIKLPSFVARVTVALHTSAGSLPRRPQATVAPAVVAVAPADPVATEVEKRRRNGRRKRRRSEIFCRKKEKEWFPTGLEGCRWKFSLNEFPATGRMGK